LQKLAGGLREHARMLPGVRKEIANQAKCDPWIERLQLIWTLGQISFLRFVQKSTVVQIALAVSRLRLQSTAKKILAFIYIRA